MTRDIEATTSTSQDGNAGANDIEQGLSAATTTTTTATQPEGSLSNGGTSTNSSDSVDTPGPNKFSNDTTRRQRLYRSAKVGLAAVLASLTVLIPSLDKFFHGTGQWAVITVVLVILDTPGDTLQKTTNRFVGTILAAALALAIGTAAARLEHSLVWGGAAEFLVCCAVLVVTTIGTWVTSGGGDWAYGVLLGTATFPFMALDAMRDQLETAIFRAVMISIGGVIGLLLAWLPPTVPAGDAAKARLLDGLVDTGRCVEHVVECFVHGRRLNSIRSIYYAGQDDDPAHELYKAVVLSRSSLESAVEASRWEWKTKGMPSCKYRECGLAVRLVLRAIQAADMLLRTRYRPLDVEQRPFDARLADSLRDLARAIRIELFEIARDVDPTIVLDGTDVCEDIGSELKDNGIALSAAVDNLELAMMDKTRDDIGACDSGVAPGHIAFGWLLMDAGKLALEVRRSLDGSNTTKEPAETIDGHDDSD